MAGYLLITELRCPTKLQAKLADSLADIATPVVVQPDTVRIQLLEGVDLSKKVDMDLVVRSILHAVQDCGETTAQGGFFSD